MKKTILLSALMLAAALTAGAQRLATGARAPEIRVGEWLGSPAAGDGVMLVEFFHTSSAESVARLAALDALARKYGPALTVVVIAREGRDKVAPVLTGTHYHAALDDGGKTFSDFGVRFVPFAVLTDSRGRVVWFGNPATLDDETVAATIK